MRKESLCRNIDFIRCYFCKNEMQNLLPFFEYPYVACLSKTLQCIYIQIIILFESLYCYR